ncbi:MAG: LysM domain-containing protein [Anaerolineae bacterium]|jgi:LysM repeat protein
MCGTSLDGEEEPPEPEEKRRRVPGWVGSVIAVLLGIAILAGGGYGLYSMLGVEPEAVPTMPAVTSAPTATPTTSPTPTRTLVPTLTPTPLPPRAHNVQQGETLSDIAEEYGITLEEILALNPELSPELIRAGEVLLIPAATLAPGELPPGAFAEPGMFSVHVVKPGETLISIAEAYGVPLALLQTANDLVPGDETIRIGQSLVIPQPTPTPSPSPTAIPIVTSTPWTSYAPPPLLYPIDGMAFTEGEAPILLQWASVSLLQEDEWYQLSLWQPSGGVVSSTVRTRATAWRVPLDLLESAGPDAPGFLWQVQVVRAAGEESYVQAGSPSRARSFFWFAPARSPTPPTTPSP